MKDKITVPSGFREISPEELGNAFKMIGKEWMLICATDEKWGVSGMTASWGCFGVLWNKPVCVCFIRPQRHTCSLVEESEYVTLNFFGDGHRRELGYFGRASGRDTDKAADMEMETAGGERPYFTDAKTVLFCRKLYADDLKKDKFIDKEMLSHYPLDDFHRVYVCEIECAAMREE